MTCFTFVLFIMGLHVSPQCFSSEGFATHFAHAVFSRRFVYFDVMVEARLAHEAFATRGTLVWFTAGVGADMFLQVFFPRAGSTTQLAVEHLTALVALVMFTESICSGV